MFTNLIKDIIGKKIKNRVSFFYWFLNFFTRYISLETTGTRERLNTVEELWLHEEFSNSTR